MREAKLAVVGVVEMCANCEGCEIDGQSVFEWSEYMKR